MCILIWEYLTYQDCHTNHLQKVFKNPSTQTLSKLMQCVSRVYWNKPSLTFTVRRRTYTALLPFQDTECVLCCGHRLTTEWQQHAPDIRVTLTQHRVNIYVMSRSLTPPFFPSHSCSIKQNTCAESLWQHCCSAYPPCRHSGTSLFFIWN